VTKLLAAVLLFLLVGCTVERNGTVHHVILGFGVVSVNKTASGATVTRARVLGLYCREAPGTCAAGYASQTTIEVPTNSNVVIEVK